MIIIYIYVYILYIHTYVHTHTHIHLGLGSVRKMPLRKRSLKGLLKDVAELAWGNSGCRPQGGTFEGLKKGAGSRSMTNVTKYFTRGR